MELRKKKEENCVTSGFKSREIGDAYSYLAFKRDTQFFIGFVVGKWNEYTCDDFYKMLASRLRFATRKKRVTILSDGNKQNLTAIPKNFPQCAINYALRKKIRRNGEIISIVSRVILGQWPKNDIGITQLDGFCSKLRERISCFTRKARSFAKRKQCIEERLEIFSIQHNFIEKKKWKTPAMKEGIINKKLNWTQILHARLSYSN